MEVKVCDFCGTEFDAELIQCPLCGKASVESARPGQTAPKKKRGGRYAAAKPVKEKKPKERPADAPPRWVMILLCSVMGVAVLGLAAFALSRLGWVSALLPERVEVAQNVEPVVPEAEDISVQAPAVEEEAGPATPDQYTNEEDYVPEQKPAEETKPVDCTGLTLNTTAITFDEQDQFFNITYTRQPATCTEEVTFTSSDESVATVNQQGKIVAVNAGSTTVTAMCGNYTETCLVTCDFGFVGEETEEETLPLALNSVDMTLFYPGEQAALYVENKPNDVPVTYASEDKNIASISATGVITAEGSGTTTVTATVGDQTLSCVVRCNLGSTTESGETAAVNCKLSHADVTMSIQNEYFKISLQDENGKAVSGVSWKSTDPKVCTVDSSGVVTAVGHGTAYVTTTYNGVTYQCIVRCAI